MEQSRAFIKSFPFTMLASVLITVGLVVFGYKTLGLSFLLGSMTMMMTMSMLYKSSYKLMVLEKQDASKKATFNYATRYALYAIVLVVAGLSDNLDILMVAAGLLLFKIILLILLFLEKRRGGNND